MHVSVHELTIQITDTTNWLSKLIATNGLENRALKIEHNEGSVPNPLSFDILGNEVAVLRFMAIHGHPHGIFYIRPSSACCDIYNILDTCGTRTTIVSCLPEETTFTRPNRFRCFAENGYVGHPSASGLSYNKLLSVLLAET